VREFRETSGEEFRDDESSSASSRERFTIRARGVFSLHALLESQRERIRGL